MSKLHDRYYEPDSEDDDWVDWYPCRVADYMNGAYSITQYSNFTEGISEAKDADRLIIEEMLSKPHADIDFAALGRKLWDMSFTYMEHIAQDMANEDWERGYRD
jgi:hypothetical protein